MLFDCPAPLTFRSDGGLGDLSQLALIGFHPAANPISTYNNTLLAGERQHLFAYSEYRNVSAPAIAPARAPAHYPHHAPRCTPHHAKLGESGVSEPAYPRTERTSGIPIPALHCLYQCAVVALQARYLDSRSAIWL